jgi:hypothetical protein
MVAKPVSSPVLSVVIPAFGRVEPLKYTLRSIARSIQKSGSSAEIIVVDDGSEPALETGLRGFDAGHPLRFLRQSNQGSIVARASGLDVARGRFVTFVDSDDLVHPEKFARQIPVMEETGADVTYTDRADVTLGRDYEVSTYRASRTYPSVEDPLVLFTQIQPSPHSPVYRRDYLQRVLSPAILPHNRLFDPSGDFWLFRNLAFHPAAVRRVPGHFAGVGPHEEERFTGCWEKLAIASLGIDEATLNACDKRPGMDRLRCSIAKGAFHAFRVLPFDVLPEFQQRILDLWRRAPELKFADLGGRGFQVLAVALGPVGAARLLRRLKRPSYAQCKTLCDEEEFAKLLAMLPTPPSAAREHTA